MQLLNKPYGGYIGDKQNSDVMRDMILRFLYSLKIWKYLNISVNSNFNNFTKSSV